VGVDIDFINRYIDGIYISDISPIDISLKGNMKSSQYRVESEAVEVIGEDIYLKSPIELSGGVSIVKGDIEYLLSLKPDSTAGYGVVDSSGKFKL